MNDIKFLLGGIANITLYVIMLVYLLRFTYVIAQVTKEIETLKFKVMDNAKVRHPKKKS